MIGNNDIDSLLFDMDGTLWDATGSYAAVWNRCFADCGIDIRLTGADLVPYMGKPIEVIVEGITSGRVPAAFSRDAFVAALGDVHHFEGVASTSTVKCAEAYSYSLSCLTDSLIPMPSPSAHGLK